MEDSLKKILEVEDNSAWFARIVDLRINGNINAFCSSVKNLMNSHLIEFFKYIRENNIEI